MKIFGMKWARPLSYMGTKLIANSIHGMIAPRATSNLRCLDLTRHQVSAQSVRAQMLRAQPFRDRPAAVKRNGGLRGSTATRW